jgi:hypothetical protein
MPADAKVLYMVVQCGACKAKFAADYVDRELDYSDCWMRVTYPV